MDPKYIVTLSSGQSYEVETDAYDDFTTALLENVKTFPAFGKPLFNDSHNAGTILFVTAHVIAIAHVPEKPAF